MVVIAVGRVPVLALHLRVGVGTRVLVGSEDVIEAEDVGLLEAEDVGVVEARTLSLCGSKQAKATCCCSTGSYYLASTGKCTSCSSLHWGPRDSNMIDENTSRLDIFLSFFHEWMVNTVSNETNRYAVVLIAENPPTAPKRHAMARLDTTTGEIKRFLAMCIVVGLCKNLP